MDDSKIAQLASWIVKYGPGQVLAAIEEICSTQEEVPNSKPLHSKAGWYEWGRAVEKCDPDR